MINKTQILRWLLGGLCGALLLTACASAPDTDTNPVWVVSERLSIEQIHPDIWIHTSRRTLDSGETFPANGLLVRHGQQLMLIDTAWGEDITQELLRWIENQLRLPVSQAVVTHFHADSMGGAGVLAARNIPFSAHPLSLVLADNQGLPLPEPISELHAADTVTLDGVEIFYPGPAHSRDNIVIWIPHARVLFGGCAIRSAEFKGTGNTADADLDNWPKAIKQVRQRYPDIQQVVPGHGQTGGPDLLTHTIALFAPG